MKQSHRHPDLPVVTPRVRHALVGIGLGILLPALLVAADPLDRAEHQILSQIGRWGVRSAITAGISGAEFVSDLIAAGCCHATELIVEPPPPAHVDSCVG